MGQNNKTATAVSVASVCVAAAVCAGAVMYVNHNRSAEPAVTPQSGSSIVISDDNRDYVSMINDKVKKGYINIKMTQNWVFENGGETSNAYLANSERNGTDLRFELTLADTGEIIMVSPDVPVGSCIENFPLSVKLDPGTYQGIVAHQQVENGEVINTVSTYVTFEVK